MGNGSGVSRGDRNRNARLDRLRALVLVQNAIVGIDPADNKQMVVVTDHDSKVLARRTFRCRAWDLGVALDWASERANVKGFRGVTIACEPTGHRWRVLSQLAAARSMPFVCVQPMVTSWARRAEDLTHDKTDEKDAVLIARLTAQLRCYEPEPVDETWARLRHLGARREQLITEINGQLQQMRDLLECVWPAALDCTQQPFRSNTWIAALSVIADRDSGNLARTRRLGPARFEHAVRRQIIKQGGQKPCGRITTKLFTALSDSAGVTAHRAGVMERVQLLLEDWRHAHARLADTEQRMTSVLDELGLTGLVTSITGISAVGGAAILAQTGDPRRFATARAGQARWPGSAGETVGQLRGPHQAHRPRPARVAARGLACRVGSATHQFRLRRPLPAPHHPRAQQAATDPSADRHCRRDPATPARRDHHRPSLGPDHRHERHQGGEEHAARGLNSADAAHQADGRGEPYAA